MNPATPPLHPLSTPPAAGETHSDEHREAAPSTERSEERDPESLAASEPELAAAKTPELVAQAGPEISTAAETESHEDEVAEPELLASAEPEARTAAEPEIAAAAGPETLPVPAGPRRIDSPEARPGKINFWKRIAMRRSDRARNAAQTGELLAKVNELDERLESTQATILGRLDRMSEQIESVWAIEEQLSQLAVIQEKLDTMQTEQRGISEAVSATSSQAQRSPWGSSVAFVLLLAAAAAGAIALVRMGL
jgi:hypothetical protein